MNDLEFRKQILDTKSASFCAAKWYNATIWLGSGMSTSCHHPPAHQIDTEAIKLNPKAIHNTVEKKMDRLDMQLGTRPKGCEYCWKIEDMGRDSISDRVYKSKIYPIESLDEAYKKDHREDVDLRTLEIAFDRTCQFACSYCNPAFSSTWVRDIRTNGAYTSLVSLMGGTISLILTIPVLNSTPTAKQIPMLKPSLLGGSQTYTRRFKNSVLPVVSHL
jgi:hypothetical protein